MAFANIAFSNSIPGFDIQHLWEVSEIQEAETRVYGTLSRSYALVEVRKDLMSASRIHHTSIVYRTSRGRDQYSQRILAKKTRSYCV